MTRENSDMLRNFAQQMRETAKSYASELLAENTKLVELGASLHAANAKLLQELADLRPLRRENAELRGMLDALTLEHQKASDELAELRARAQRERDALLGRAREIAEMTQKSRELSARFSEVDRTSERLANWFIAIGRLHEATNASQVVALLGEILIHLVGTQRFGIFTTSSNGESISLASSLGVDVPVLERLPALTGRVASASRGIAYLRAPGEESAIELEADLSACIPLRAHGLTLGVVALFDWSATPEVTRTPALETLTLLVKHGGTALLTCQLLSALNAMHTVAA